MDWINRIERAQDDPQYGRVAGRRADRGLAHREPLRGKERLHQDVGPWNWWPDEPGSSHFRQLEAMRPQQLARAGDELGRKKLGPGREVIRPLQLNGKAAQVARDAVLEEEIRLPAELRAAIRRVHRARERAAAAVAELRDAQSAAALALSETRSLRDAGELLGLSHQAIKKILAASSSGSGKKRTRQR